ncbi:MAG: DUF1579 family protein [Candidatus Heimdallarchaeota archaeon]|nr:DUF1579 family protein [Candidatus Heimdallarchaeota archaeon]
MTLDWQKYVGNWRGYKEIYLQPGVLHSKNDTAAKGSMILNEKFLMIEYYHIYEKKKYEGQLLIGFDPENEQTQSSWIDEWHNQRKIMQMAGGVSGNKIVLNGKYYTGTEEWGWKIEVFMEDDKLQIVHYNITPHGQSAIGVNMLYTRHNDLLDKLE